MKFTDIIKKIYPNIKIPKRRSEKQKLRSLKRSVSKRGLSLVHKDVIKSIPKDKGLWTHVTKASPASYGTKAGKKMQNIIIESLRKDLKTSEINKKIGEKDIEVLILYLFASKNKKRDIDNYNKNIIDALRKGGLFKDDRQIKFQASCIKFLKIKDKRYYRSIEKAIIRVDFLKPKNKLYQEFNKIFKGD